MVECVEVKVILLDDTEEIQVVEDSDESVNIEIQSILKDGLDYYDEKDVRIIIPYHQIKRLEVIKCESY